MVEILTLWKSATATNYNLFFLESQLLNVYITPLAETIGKGPFAFYFVAMAVKYNPKVAKGPFWSFGESLLTKRTA